MTKGRRQVLVSVWSTIGLLIVYAVVLQYLGFILSTMLYLFVQMIVLAGERKTKYVTLVLISVVASTGIYALFVYGLELMLPAGILG
jgi:putative tricarboxylic transport membrane protein